MNEDHQLETIDELYWSDFELTDFKAALSSMVAEIIGPDLPPDVVTDSGVGYSRQQIAINMGKAGVRQRAIAKGFIIPRGDA